MRNVKQAFQSRNSEGRDAESDRRIVLKLFSSQDIRGVMWIIVAKKRDKWSALVNTEIHLRLL
jgi:hypothetical protein